MIGIEAIKITPDILRRLCDIDEFKGYWRGLEDHTTGLHMLGDVAVFGQAFNETLKPLQDQSFDAKMLKRLHASLEGEKSLGEFKTDDTQLMIFQDDILAGFLDTAAPEQVAALTDKLLGWLNDSLNRTDLHPLIVAAVFTAVFLQISPFEKDNQKLARLMITLMMLKSGYSYAPYASIESIMNEKGGEIFRALKHNQQSVENGLPDWSEWIRCFLRLLQEQKDTLHKRLRSQGENLAELPALSANIVALFEDNKRLQMNEIITMTGGRRSTIKLRLGELVESGYLRRHGKARSTWYALN